MGWTDSANVSIGFKIKLGYFIPQIQEEKIKECEFILFDGFLDDENEHFSEKYHEVMESCYFTHVSKNKNVEEFKRVFMEETKKYGTDIHTYYGTQEQTLEMGSLYEQYLLFPYKSIISTARYGYSREGTNGTSKVIDFDIESIRKEIYEKYEWIKGFEIVMMVKQRSG